MARATDAGPGQSYLSADVNHYERNTTWTPASAQVPGKDKLKAWASLTCNGCGQVFEIVLVLQKRESAEHCG
jgi:hypothetical protein